MSTIRLGDFITEITEKTIVNNQYRVLTSSQDGIVSQDEYFNKHVASKDTTGYKIIRKGQFTYRAMSDTGRFYINQLSDYDIGIVSPAYPIFEIKDNYILYPAFLQSFFRSDYFQSLIANQSWGSTRVSLKLDIIKKIEIYLPPLEIQHQIVENLDKVTHLIDLCNQILDKLDLLVKSRFVEMFGDTESNSNGFPTYKLSSLCAVSSSKRIYQDEQSSSGVPFLRISNLVELIESGYFNSDLFIPEGKYHELLENDLVPKAGDILVTSRGTLGKCYIVQKNDKFYFQDGMISWLYDIDSSITPLYLTLLFDTRDIKRQIENLQSGSTVAYLSIAMLKKLNIVVPPITLQEQFAAFVEQTDKSKLAVKKVLEKAETLKKALMQEYFG